MRKGSKHTEEALKKIGEATKARARPLTFSFKGGHHSSEIRQKMSESRKGGIGPMLGKHHSQEARERIRLGHIGKKFSNEHREKISLSNKGKVFSIKTRQRMSQAAKAKPTITQETRTRMKAAMCKEKNPNWRGGVTPTHQLIRGSVEYSLWRNSVFRRDNWTCVLCGAKDEKGKRVVINADHIKPFALYPELRFSLENGRTLCVPCHKNTDTYGSKVIHLLKNMQKADSVVLQAFLEAYNGYKQPFQTSDEILASKDSGFRAMYFEGAKALCLNEVLQQELTEWKRSLVDKLATSIVGEAEREAYRTTLLSIRGFEERLQALAARVHKLELKKLADKL